MRPHFISLLAACAILSCTTPSISAKRVKAHFKPMSIENLEPRPDFWKVRPAEVIEICKGVRTGKAVVEAKTPLGYPVYAVYFGDFSEPAPQTNWSAGGSSSSRKAYIGENHRQTIMFIAGVHGSEPENVACAVNLISLLDSGKDLRGKEDPEFLELARNYNIIIMPCVNMDGRLISPDHFRNQPYEVFRGASQGLWKDGSLVGWRGSKEWFPLPLDKVSYPGGYPNSEGYNIQHDACPGDMKTEEAKAVCRIAARYRVDFFLNGHSCEYTPFIIPPSTINTPENLEKGLYYTDLINKAIFEAGLVRNLRKKEKCENTINLTTIVALCSGAVSLTLENGHSCYVPSGKIFSYTFDEMMEPAIIALREVMKDGLKEPIAKR